MLKCLMHLLLLVVSACFVLQATAKSDSVIKTRESLLVEHPCPNLKRHEIESHLSTKTPYRVVANLDDKPLTYSGCRATRIWAIIRHGTRNPSKEHIEEAKLKLVRLKEQILKNAQTKLCPEELIRLRNWQFNVSSEEEKYLTAEGEDELVELAERMQNRFPDLLFDQYHPDFYYFKYTKTQRTLKSAQSFTSGLFGRHRIGSVEYPEALHKDPVLRFYKLCKRWKIDVDNNPKTFDNAERFLNEPEMIDAVNFIRRRTQIQNITAQEAKLIYTICGFETAWNRRKDPSVWCNLFNQDTIKALEFFEDLEYYWNDGYGFEITHRIACAAMENMFEYIDPNSNKPNATFYFTHSGTLLKVLAHLGLYKDAEPLTYRDFGRERAWRTSVIDTFATNLAFVLYECNKENGSMVLTLHQERPIRLPGCPQDQDLCSLTTLKKQYTQNVSNCDLEELCHNEQHVEPN
ncbi:multiple inositol polyphosphate phosphatase 1-like isoform X2 [Anastrepha obliqua]|uniref:multiple inositol polyphosphate phosphatase 1-like isoform X2 n=1 Tax=Anastrepha obliqua TaxID=95512 RepID=UPI002409C239|nr:multiple inositol polyphosphate phosphatase 1-like isoform X2 [Anastrepha obliqua]